MHEMSTLFIEPVENYFAVNRDKYQQADFFLKPVSHC